MQVSLSVRINSILFAVSGTVDDDIVDNVSAKILDDNGSAVDIDTDSIIHEKARCGNSIIAVIEDALYCRAIELKGG